MHILMKINILFIRGLYGFVGARGFIIFVQGVININGFRRCRAWICDILVVNVDAEEAVGVLELVEQQPKVGDKATTNL